MAGASIDQLGIYNGAALLLRERKVAATNEGTKLANALNFVWSRDGVLLTGVAACLEMGQWKFAIRSAQLQFDPDVTPPFGLRYAFGLPADFLRTTALCSDPAYRVPLENYVEEAGSWFADITPIYVRYVSDDDRYGFNYPNWPETFILMVQAYFAVRVCKILTVSKAVSDDCQAAFKTALVEAQSKDAMEGPTDTPALGSWSLSRYGRGSGRWDRGNQNRLIG